MRYFLLFITLFGVLFSGCSLKKVYEPQHIDGDWEATQDIDKTIIDKTASVALLSNDEVITKKESFSIQLDENYRVLGKNGNYILATDIKGDLKLYDVEDPKSVITLSLDKTIAAASTDGEVVAVVFASGKLALYDLATKDLLATFEAQNSIALDTRIVNPYFMNDLVLFLTLDGKIIIVNKRLKKKLRTIIISSADYFNNVIYFTLLNDKLIVATATKILSFGASQARKDIEPREITHDGEHLYVATKQGDILELDDTLNTIAKTHFAFAHFLALQIVDDKIYALEKEGYLIELSKDLLSYKIYEVDFDDEANVFAKENSFIVGDEKIVLQPKKDQNAVDITTVDGNTTK